MPAVSSISELREFYLSESACIRQAFEASGDAMAAVRARADLVDAIVRRADGGVLSGRSNFALVALGGYGRQTLFPFSDVDLMFLCASDSEKSSARTEIRRMSQDLWDLRWKLSPTTRTLDECDRVSAENIEFTISLMDARFVGGDENLFRRFRFQMFPSLLQREWQTIVQMLVERQHVRHEKYGRTIFHLEPNIKEAPGGLRDYNVACWLKRLDSLEDQTDQAQSDLEQAFRFLAAVRVFLHYRAGRDDNILSWEAQEQASARFIGVNGQVVTSFPHWMRTYFRFARIIDRTTMRLLQDVPGRRSSLYQQFLRGRGRMSHADFSVAGGQVFFQRSASASDGDTILRCFELIAFHGFQLAAETEALIQRNAGEAISRVPPASVRDYVVSILRSPHAVAALRAMHSAEVLTKIIPEFQLIDALVIRDFYHRYTVDEHTFTAIGNLHRLPTRENQWEKYFAELLHEVEQPEILYLALLLHDLGKGRPAGDHTRSSVELARLSLHRLCIAEPVREEILFLIRSHLEMSAALRRDIFDPENIRAFAAKIGTPERLRLLCLMTYADIRAVNPDALTPWKAENLWRLYVATNNQLNRGIDDHVIHANAESAQIRRLHELIPNRSRQLQEFLEGLPQRYLLSHTPDQIAVHFDISLRLGRDPVALAIKLNANLYELSVVTGDRPFVFARVAGAMAAWGMNIIRANAFSNAAGVVVDSFFFKDRFRTLELNPSERERFKRSVCDVISGRADLDQLLQRRVPESAPALNVATRITMDNSSSSHSTVVEVVAQDRPGLLYLIASEISEYACNIELALIDTEGQTAIDVFYITRKGKKLSSAMVRSLHRILQAALSES